MTSQCREPAEQSFDMMKNISRKNDKVWLKLFFIRGSYNSPGTFVRPSRDLPDSLYKILFIIIRFIVVLIFAYFVEKYWSVVGFFCLPDECKSAVGSLRGPFRKSLKFFPWNMEKFDDSYCLFLTKFPHADDKLMVDTCLHGQVVPGGPGFAPPRKFIFNEFPGGASTGSN